MKTFKINNQEVRVNIEHYHNGRNAIELVCVGGEDDGVTYTVATMNVPHAPLKDGQVLIKDYGENQGVLQALVDNGVVTDSEWTMEYGFVEFNVCNLLV